MSNRRDATNSRRASSIMVASNNRGVSNSMDASNSKQSKGRHQQQTCQDHHGQTTTAETPGLLATEGTPATTSHTSSKDASNIRGQLKGRHQHGSHTGASGTSNISRDASIRRDISSSTDTISQSSFAVDLFAANPHPPPPNCCQLRERQWPPFYPLSVFLSSEFQVLFAFTIAIKGGEGRGLT